MKTYKRYHQAYKPWIWEDLWPKVSKIGGIGIALLFLAALIF